MGDILFKEFCRPSYFYHGDWRVGSFLHLYFGGKWVSERSENEVLTLKLRIISKLRILSI